MLNRIVYVGLLVLLCSLVGGCSQPHEGQVSSIEEALWLIEEYHSSTEPIEERLKCMEEASSLLEPEFKAEPSNQVVALSLGHCYHVLAKHAKPRDAHKHYVRAEAVLRQAIANDKGDYQAYSLLADVLTGLGKDEEAKLMNRQSNEVHAEFLDRTQKVRSGAASRDRAENRKEGNQGVAR